MIESQLPSTSRKGHQRRGVRLRSTCYMWFQFVCRDSREGERVGETCFVGISADRMGTPDEEHVEQNASCHHLCMGQTQQPAVQPALACTVHKATSCIT